MLDLYRQIYLESTKTGKIENNKFDTAGAAKYPRLCNSSGMEEVPAQTVAISEDELLQLKMISCCGKISRVSNDGLIATYFVSYEMYYE